MSMIARSYIAIDLGAESGRVIVGRLQDGRLTVEEIHRFTNGPVHVGKTLRWDLERLWKEVRKGMRKVAAEGKEIESISVDSWGVDYVLFDPGRPMEKMPFCYRDGRTEVPYERIRKTIGEERIYGLTGVQFMPLNTLYQLAAENQDEAEGGRGKERVLMIGDWFHHQLCGRMVQEESNASTTQLWNPCRREWSGELIEEAGLTRDIFPEVVPPCTCLGSLSPDLQADTGLGNAKVVAGCVHDTGAAVAAVPARGKGWAYLSSGTWSLIGVELEQPLITAEGRAANFTNETGACGTTRFLRNASGLWMLQECRRFWANSGEKPAYETLTKLAEESEPFRSLVDPTDLAFLRPDDMTKAIREYCRRTGQPEPETQGHFVRCVLESLALLYRSMLDQLERVTGEKLHTLHIVGGGSKNTLLNQMTADATGRAVVAGPVEATAIGNVLLQALTLGHISSHTELRSIVADSFPVEKYTPRNIELWEKAGARGSVF